MLLEDPNNRLLLNEPTVGLMMRRFTMVAGLWQGIPRELALELFWSDREAVSHAYIVSLLQLLLLLLLLQHRETLTDRLEGLS